MTASANRNVNVYGLAEIDVAIDGSTFNELGTTRDGVGITSDGYFIEVKNDENGGEAGPPVEIQYLGETHKVRCELTKYDAVVAAALEDHYSNTAAGPGGGTAGKPAYAGTLMFASSGGTNQVYTYVGGACAIKVKCSSVNGGAVVRTYTLCVIHDAIEVNRGTKFSTFVITFTAYKDPNNSNKIYAEAST